MNFVIVIHFLASVVLTAPQQQRVGGDIKPFKKVPTDFTHCLIKDDGPFLPPTPIPSKECTGTMTYCFRRLYKMPQNRENYTSINECLRSIRDTKEKLGVPGVNIEAVVDNFKKLRDWIRDTTTEKYMVLLEYGEDTIPYN